MRILAPVVFPRCGAAIVLCCFMGCGGDDGGAATSATDSDPTANAAAGQSPSTMAGSEVPTTESYEAGGGGAEDYAGADMAGSAAGYPGGAPDGGAGYPGAEGGYPGAEGGYPGGGAGYPGAEGGYPGGDPAMMSGYDPSGNYEAGGGAGGPGYGQGQPGRPGDVRQWTDDQLLAAVDERDARVLQAIEARAESSVGDPAFVELMADVVGRTSPDGSVPGAAGGPIPGAAGYPSSLQPAQPGGPRPVPPGGAWLEPTFRHSDRPHLQRPYLDSLEVMLGESLLGFSPQAAQATRGAAANLQNSAANAQNSTAAGYPGGGYPAAAGAQGYPADGSADPATMSQTMQPGMEGYPGAGYPGGAAMGSDYPNGAPGYPSSGYENGGSGYGGGNRPAGNLQNKDLIAAVVRGLVKNNSPQAWTMIEGIVEGTVRTPLSADDNSELVIREVFSAPSPNIQKVQTLLEAAVSNAVRNPGNSAATFRSIAAVAQRPADHFLALGRPAPPPTQPGGPAPGGGRMQGQMAGYPEGAMAGYPNPGMGAGGAAMAGYPNDPSAMANPGYEEGSGFSGYPGTQGMGPGGAAAPPPFPPVPVAEAAFLPVAQTLWSPSITSQLADLLQAEASLASAGDMLAFASTIPSDDVRHAAFDLLSRSHAEGAESLTSSGLFKVIARDPGMLSVLKALPRERPGQPAGPPGVPGPELSWVRATQDMVLSLKQRLADVSDDPNLAFDGLLPVRLHKDGVPERSIRVVIPGPAAEALGDAAPDKTIVYYTRVRVVPQRVKDMQDIVEHYEKRTKGIKREDRARGILWYDGVKESTDGTIQTMDVVLEQVSGGNAGGGNAGGYEAGYGGAGAVQGGGGAGGGVQFTVEIIVVVTRNPDKPLQDTSVTASDL
ncbi:MAG: hypothetical protein RIK87_03485 [Fuerstiella sp.]